MPGLTRHVLANRSIAPLSAADHARLEGAISAVRIVPPRTVIVRKGEALEHSTLLVRGFMSRHVDDRHGQRQLVSLHIAGDLVDLHAYPMKRLDHDIASLSEAEIAILPHAAIREITAADPELARKLWFATLLDAAMHREWIFRLGRLDGPGRVCHFFAETQARMQAVGLAGEREFELPLTQIELGEACGLSAVHINRVMKALREGGLCTLAAGRVALIDPAGVARRGQFDPAYLYLDPPPPGAKE